MSKFTILRADRLIDGTGAPAIDDAVILIADDKIVGVGNAGSLELPEGAEQLSFEGCTLMPGLIDAHIHLAMFNHLTFSNYQVAQLTVGPELQQMYMLFHAQLCFEMGITTVRDMGLAASRGLLTESMCAVRDSINAGLFAGPRILVAGWVNMTASHLDRILPKAVPRAGLQSGDGPYELRKLVRIHARTGADFIKTAASGGFTSEGVEEQIRNLTQEELDAIVDEAHAAQLPVSVHCFTPDSQRAALQAGCDTIEHCIFTDDDAIKRIIDAGVHVIPTLSHRSDRAITVRKDMGTPKRVLEAIARLQPHAYETFKQMYICGVKLAMGTDMGYDPDMGENAYELELYTSLGMSSMEAIVSSTSVAAEAIGLEDKIGTLASGKYADLIAVQGNPLDDLAVLRNRESMKLVMKAGAVFVDRREGHNKEILPGEYLSWRKIDT